MDVRRTVGRNLRWCREAAGLSQGQLAKLLAAKKLGVTQSYISELEHGRRNPTIVTLSYIARALKVSVAKLVEDRPEHGR
ncbi:helix-turn-helix domain-containing protein [Microvirga massiliensis]|uniref:helix-turn-helix domain-containing protein n=1 Tax=Microvirga massiliensis TaxID=1033741 RepID=UPI0006612DCD|nr:helix-turn-helix transcriptional regulator [Microvirga massiliensis]